MERRWPRAACSARVPYGPSRATVADLRHALRQVPALAVGVIQDGAPELWNLLRPALLAEPLVTACYEAIDRYHLTERLADVLRYGGEQAFQLREGPLNPDYALRVILLVKSLL